METNPSREFFTHHVFFYLKNPTSEEDKAALMAGLRRMTKIVEIRLAQIGVPAATNRSVIVRDYQVSWLLMFGSVEDEATYQTHPVHKKFVEECAHLWEKVVIYDSLGGEEKDAIR